MTVDRRKLIEVSLPLEVINREAAREKSIRHGHPSTLHLWWARRPLAAARAVLFAQLVDDPSAHPDRYPTEEDQQRRREELHRLIEKLVVWENSNNPDILAEAHKEILDSMGGNPPTIIDPFAGGGTIPLEAQRLGLNAVASDINPVAVLINKALIEVPPKFKDKKPVYPQLADSQIRRWKGAQGLAADVRAYGQWIGDEAKKRIGDLYPAAILPDDSSAPVIAWIWARTVTCPNPRCGIQMPLVRTWWLGKKRGKEAYIVPTVRNGTVHYEIARDVNEAPSGDSDGTIRRGGATCVSCKTAVEFAYIKGQGQANRIAAQLMAIAAAGNRRRIYLPPDEAHAAAASVNVPPQLPDGAIPQQALGFRVQAYGFRRYTDLFTARQLTALSAFSDLVAEARDRVFADAVASGQPTGDRLASGGAGAAAYADAVATYLALCIDRSIDRHSNISTWDASSSKEQVRGTFARQTLSMAWDFAESNPFSSSSGSYSESVSWVARVLEALAPANGGVAQQANAIDSIAADRIISTDPPYYDNIGYADLSDFFYVWLRRSLQAIWPDLFATILVPKADELVANPFRHNGNDGARSFFEDGFTSVFRRAREVATLDTLITLYYAFKQGESSSDGSTSAGWETLLTGIVTSGWMITGTWPIRSELGNRMRSIESNALGSSVVLALRPRDDDAAVIDRRGFIATLNAELPMRLRQLQQGAVAPVDLHQAAIGPGMAVFTRYARVIESDGSAMTVASAYTLLNQVVDQVLSEQEGDFDATTRFAISWYRQYGYSVGSFDAAEKMTRGRNTSVPAMERAGILTSRGGKVSLLDPSGLPSNYDPVADVHISAWEVLHYLIRTLNADGVTAAGAFLAVVSNRSDGGIDPALVKELAFLLFSVADNKKWTTDAIAFNNIATSWADLLEASRSSRAALASDLTFDFTTEEEDV